MSVTLKVVLEGVEAASHLPASGKDLARQQRELDRAAHAAGVAPLATFVHRIEQELQWARDALALPDDGELSVDDEEVIEEGQWAALPKVGTWYSPDEGLRTVSAVLRRLSNEPASAYTLDDSVVGDLQALEEI